ncbi:MAG: 50S ribosomal protein L25 [Calditrichia bacterium]
MAENIVVSAKPREKTGKSAAKKYRAQGLIPAEFYSSHEENMHLLLDKKDFEMMLSKAHGLLDLEIEGAKKKFLSVVKDLQYHPVRGDVLHVDFLGVKRGEKLTIHVPIVLQGTAAGVKAGGILEHIIREVEVECLPKDLPEQLEIDITNLEIGDSIRVKDLKFENIRILDDPEETILLIEHARLTKEVEEMEAAEMEEEEEKEPEVITSRKEEEEEEE